MSSFASPNGCSTGAQDTVEESKRRADLKNRIQIRYLCERCRKPTPSIPTQKVHKCIVNKQSSSINRLWDLLNTSLNIFLISISTLLNITVKTNGSMGASLGGYYRLKQKSRTSAQAPAIKPSPSTGTREIGRAKKLLAKYNRK